MINYKKNIPIVAILLVFLSMQLQAAIINKEVKQDDDIFSFSGSGVLTSNLIGRGVSLSKDRPAAEASFRINSKWGFYTDITGSSINFTDSQDDIATILLNLKIAYLNEYQGVKYDFGFVQYVRPATTLPDFNEVFIDLKYKIFNIGANYSNNIFDSADKSIYAYFGIDYTLDAAAGLLKNIGLHGYIARFNFYGPALGAYSFNYYKLGISKAINKNIDFSVSVTDTNRGFVGIVSANRVSTKVFATLELTV